MTSIPEEIRTSERSIQISDKETPESSQPWVKTYSGGKPNYTQPEPEPVAYINVEERKLEWATPIKWETPTVVKMDKVPLYTKKEWVGLTDDERDEIREQAHYEFDDISNAIEVKLKEKNGGR